ncbi:MAG TPA: START domain-containing protein [Polyangiales bacterium]
MPHQAQEGTGRMRLYLLVACLLWSSDLSSARAQANGEWKLLAREDGVTSWKQVSDRSVPIVKAQIEIDAPIDVVKRVIQDYRTHTKWMHKCVESTLLKQVSPTEAILYNRTDSPWPIRDRDVIFRFKLQAAGGDVVLAFETEKSPTKPEVSGVIRMPRMDGFFRLTKLGDHKTRVVYQLDSDVGGSIPQWAVRDVLEKIPPETLLGLRKQIAALAPTKS